MEQNGRRGVAAIIGVGLILVTRCIDADEAWDSIDGNVLVLIFAMLAVGLALENSGSVALVVGKLTPVLADVPPWGLVLASYAISVLLTEVVTNNAVAILVTPLTIAVARDLGVDPYPLVVAVMFAASASFATPIGYQTNALVYAAGDYRFADFVRIGVPLNIIVGLAVCGALVAGVLGSLVLVLVVSWTYCISPVAVGHSGAGAWDQAARVGLDQGGVTGRAAHISRVTHSHGTPPTNPQGTRSHAL